jgi:hypothetical protein
MRSNLGEYNHCCSGSYRSLSSSRWIAGLRSGYDLSLGGEALMTFPITVRVNGSSFDLYINMGGVMKRVGNIELLTAQADDDGNCYPAGQYNNLQSEPKMIAVIKLPTC